MFQVVIGFAISFSHGDMLFVKEELQPTTTQQSTDDWVFEDEIDVTLSKEEGLVHRNRDPQL